MSKSVGSKQKAAGSFWIRARKGMTAQMLSFLPSAHCPLPTTPRPGISLLEVLFAVGILSVGILGMAALVPLGAYELVEANKLDQSSTAGRAAFRDLEVRSYLQPKLWVDTQMGMLIDPDPTNSVVASPPTYQQRIITYPYLPPKVVTSYFGTIQPVLSAPFTPSLTFPPTTSPQLYPVPFGYIYNPNAPSLVPPIGVNLLAAGTYPQLPSTPPFPYPAGYSCPPFPPLSATDGQVFVFDPLGVAEAATKYLTTGNGPATVPPYGSTPVPWTCIQTFPYQQTYNVGAPLLPRLTMLPEWPRYPVNGTLWPGVPLSPIPSWPVPAAQGGGSVQNWSTSTPYHLPPVPAPGYGPWPQPWLQSQTNLPYIQAQPRFMPLAVADRIFRSSSDLIFNPLNPTNPSSDRPTLGFTYDATGTNRQEPLYQGNYSWFATVSPASAQVDAPAAGLQDTVTQPDPSALMNARQFNVSVVVCQNRIVDMPTSLATDTTPGEWQVPARIEPGSLGGGEVTLFAYNTDQLNWMTTLKPGQWLMLSGITVAGEMRNNSGTPTFWPRFRTIANWYRIVATDEVPDPLNPPPFRRVTLSGPDWPQGFQYDDPIVSGSYPHVDFNAIMNPPAGVQYGVQFAALNTLVTPPTYMPPNASINIYAYATVVEGVVGVYQKTITVDGDSPFASQ